MSERKHDFWVRFDAAVAFASELHADQLRKGTRIPYVSHLFAVAAMVLSHGGSDDAAIAALLHDSLEDQGDSFVGGRAGLKQAIASRFGAAVLAIVEELTDDGVIEKPPSGTAGARAQWLDRKRLYIEHAKNASADACLVSCADKLHNVRSMIADHAELGDGLWTRFRTGSKSDQVWYHEELVAAFSGRAPGPLVDALNQAVARLRRL